MYFVGIDISKFKHDCAVLDEAGGLITPSWSFANDHEGFSTLRDFLNNLEGEKRIGLESTGHYGQNLKLFLESNGFTFMEFNPLLIFRFVHSKSLRNTTNDSISAQNIAHYVMTVEYKPYPPSFYHMDKLKSLTRFRDRLVRQRSRQLVELTNVLDKVFPEFKPFFKGRLSVTALYILANYQTPEKIANMRAYEPLRKLSRGRFTMSDFIQLKALAKNTVGATNDYLVDQMGILLELYSLIDAKVDELDNQIRDCIRDIDPPCLSLPGVGELSAAIILSEFGDFSKFQNPSKMLYFAGLEPGYFQSGQSEFSGHMVKHGSSKLRCALLNCCLPLVTNEPVFAEYYAKKRAEGKSHRVAMTHVAKKLLRVIYTLQTKNVPYDPDQIR